VSGDLAIARSLLFVPGSRPDRFDKAASSGADEIVLDLEDAVVDADKDGARDAIRSWLTSGGSGAVRVNGAAAELERDLAALDAVPGLRAVIVPKAEDVDVVRTVSARLTVLVLALIETAAGVANARSIARTQGVTRLAIGTIDLALDLGAEDGWDALLFARSELVISSRLAGLPGPVDGVHTTIADLRALSDATRRARSLGYTGKLCIHPTQVPTVHTAFLPSEAEVCWAEQVVDAMQERPGSRQVHGEMVDRPVLERAQLILARARAGAISPTADDP